MICAHIREKSLEEQSVKEHLYNVSEMAEEYGSKIGLGKVCKLIGVIHDLGKETNKFDNYIRLNDKSLKGTIDHSTAGARLIHNNFYDCKDQFSKISSQIVSLAICSHHGGLIDFLDLSGIDVFNNRMLKEKDIFYDEAIGNFVDECMSIDEINKMFIEAKGEIENIIKKINNIDTSARLKYFAMGILQKYIFSCLIDADRYDTYTFMEGIDRKKSIVEKEKWSNLADILEYKLEQYPKVSKIEILRAEVSLACKKFSENSTGVYKLPVPTGGGKTLSSLRYAINHAKIYGKDRIIYVVPFTTIIEQNAREIREILEKEDIVLEHHSNIILDDVDENYKILTERWDSQIIITTMVQFLDTLFKGGTQSVRRLHNLANSVIVFDEIQCLPIKCINMFNGAMNFLSQVCNSSIVLCSATQPLLSETELPLKMSENSDITCDISNRYGEFKRVNLIDSTKLGEMDIDYLSGFVIQRMKQVKSTLIIVNTKNVAKEVFNKLKNENEYLMEDDKYEIFHLSTNMCAANRLKILDEIKAKLKNKRVICVSTQLIEAGVNISFECVIRSLAGLDSIAQAAGRCNRHGEFAEFGQVHIVKIQGENVDKLVDIKQGQECTVRVLEEFRKKPIEFDNDLLSVKAMKKYYQYYFYNRSNEMSYNIPSKGTNMYDILSINNDGTNAYKGRNLSKPSLILKHAFNTAGDIFNVIDQNTTSIIVPYGNGKELITLINGDCRLDELKIYLNKAQQYAVNLFDTDKRKLESAGAIIELKNGSVLALREGFYNEYIGITADREEIKFLEI